MSTLLNLVVGGGQLLGRAAARALQEALGAGVRAREQLALECERLGRVIEEHDSMLGLIQERGPELTKLLGGDGAEVDVHVAVVDGGVRAALETYLGTLHVPLVRLGTGRQQSATSRSTSKDDQVLLTVCPKSDGVGVCPAAKGYSTRTHDEDDLDFLKRRVRDKFRRLIQANADKADAVGRRLDDIDISSTMRRVSDTQRYIVRDMENLMRCLREIDELRAHLKFVGIRDNTIHVVVMGRDQRKGGDDAGGGSDPRSNKTETRDVVMADKNEVNKCDRTFSGSKTAAHSRGFGNTYAEYLSKFVANRSNGQRQDQQEDANEIHANRKRKREDDECVKNPEMQRGIVDRLVENVRKNRRKRFCEKMIEAGFAYTGKKDVTKPDNLVSGIVEGGQSVAETGTPSRKNMFPTNVPYTIQTIFRRSDEKIRKAKEKRNAAALLLQANRNHFTEFEKRLAILGAKQRQKDDSAKDLNFSIMSALSASKKRIRMFLKTKQRERRGRDRPNKYKTHLQRMKQLEEQVRHDCSVMFANKRQFQRFEKDLKRQISRENQRKRAENLLLVNEKSFEEVETRIRREKTISQLQKEIECASLLLTENQNAFNTFQRRMLHHLVNEPSLPNLSFLCGKDVTINDKIAFDMIVEKLQTHDLIDLDEIPLKPDENEKTEISNPLSEQGAKGTEQNLFVTHENVVTNNNNIGTDENVELLAEIDGLRISIVKMPGEQVLVEEIVDAEEYLCAEHAPQDVQAVHNVSRNSRDLKMSAMKEERKMASELLEINEKVFNESEKTMSAIKIIDQKPKFSTIPTEDDSGKLLNQSKSKIGDDRRKIYTGKALFKEGSQMKAYQKSKSVDNVVADIKKRNLSLYENISEAKDKNPADRNIIDDLFKGQAFPSDNDSIVIAKVSHSSVKNKLTQRNDVVKGDGDMRAASESIDIMFPPSKQTSKSRVDSILQKSEKKKTSGKHKQDLIHKPRPPSKIPRIFSKEEGNRQSLDTQCVQDDIVTRQSQNSRHRGSRKQMLRNVIEKDEKSTRKTATFESNTKKVSARNEAIKQNKLICNNAVATVIDKDLEKRLVKKDIAASKLAHNTDNRDVTNVSQKQLKYKSPEKSRYTKIYEQIKARQAEKLQQLKAKKKAAREGITSKNKLLDENKTCYAAEDCGSGLEKPTDAKPSRQISHKSVRDYVATAEGSKQVMPHLQTIGTPTQSFMEIENVVVEEPQWKTQDHCQTEYSVETLFTSKEAKTTKCKDDSSSELDDSEGLVPALITSDNCFKESDSSNRREELVIRQLLNSRLPGLATMDDPEEFEELNDKFLHDSETLVSKTAGALRVSSEFTGGDISHDSDTSTVWEDSYQNVSDIERGPKANKLQLVGENTADSVADLNDEDAPTLSFDVMNEKDISALFSTCSSVSSLDKKVKPKLPPAAALATDDAVNAEEEVVRAARSDPSAGKYGRKPWGTNVVNEVPTQRRRASPPALLPPASLWNSQPRAPRAAAPRPRPEVRNKKYRYESKEIVMGSKVTRVTYLVEE